MEVFPLGMGTIRHTYRYYDIAKPRTPMEVDAKVLNYFMGRTMILITVVSVGRCCAFPPTSLSVSRSELWILAMIWRWSFPISHHSLPRSTHPCRLACVCELEFDVLHAFFERIVICFRRENFFSNVDMMGRWVMFGPVIGPVHCARPPVISKLTLRVAAT